MKPIQESNLCRNSRQYGSKTQVRSKLVHMSMSFAAIFGLWWSLLDQYWFKNEIV